MYLKSTQNEFYVYVYLNPLKSGNYIYDYLTFDFEPFYVGKGKGNRFKDHLSYQEGSKEKIELIHQLLDLNNYPIIIKIKERLLEDEAFEEEKKLIKLIGRKILNEGPLLNIQPGGEGFSGWIITENWREKNKQAQIKRWKNADLEYRKKHGEKIRKSFDNSITKEKLSNNMKKEWSDHKKRLKRIAIQQLPHVKEIKSRTSIEKLSKTYILISPLNKRFRTNRLGEFCKEYKIGYDSILSVAKGNHISCKGWICFRDKEGEEEKILLKIEQLKQEKKERKRLQNLNQIGKHIHNEDSKKRIGRFSKNNKYGLGYKHKQEDIEKIRESSLRMWKIRKGDN